MEWSSSFKVGSPWSSEEFIERLRQVGTERYHDKHPFQLRMNEGRLSEAEMRGWILNRFYYQNMLPIKDALIVAKLPTREDRRKWAQRIVDHDGKRGQEGGIEAWLRFGEAAGLSRDEMLNPASILPAVRFAVDGYVNFCRLESWYEGVAASLTELFAPSLVGKRVEILQKYYSWIRPEGQEYFRSRLSQTPRDVEHALDLVVRYGVTAREQEAAVAALRFKCDVLWAMLDAIETAFSDRP